MHLKFAEIIHKFVCMEMNLFSSVSFYCVAYEGTVVLLVTQGSMSPPLWRPPPIRLIVKSYRLIVKSSWLSV